MPAQAAGSPALEKYNKAVVTQFVSKILSATDADVVARQVSPQLIEHDPLAANGREGTARLDPRPAPEGA
ncbi:hypothetical protein LP420_12745 [Massilia sp. B-10]|nr:hypothetical protein LP420_12745 [Massilia sp. B-10]